MQCNDDEILALGKEANLEWFVFQWFGIVLTRIPNDLNCNGKSLNRFSFPECGHFYRSQRFSLEWTTIDTVNHRSTFIRDTSRKLTPRVGSYLSLLFVVDPL